MHIAAFFQKDLGNKMQDERYTGVVIFFRDDWGYGFIERPGEKDIFIYWSDIDPEYFKGKRRTLTKGQEVVFNLGLTNDGRLKATNLIIIKDVDGKEK